MRKIEAACCINLIPKGGEDIDERIKSNRNLCTNCDPMRVQNWRRENILFPSQFLEYRRPAPLCHVSFPIFHRAGEVVCEFCQYFWKMAAKYEHAKLKGIGTQTNKTIA